jgi:hypothetical protein
MEPHEYLGVLIAAFIIAFADSFSIGRPAVILYCDRVLLSCQSGANDVANAFASSVFSINKKQIKIK